MRRCVRTPRTRRALRPTALGIVGAALGFALLPHGLEAQGSRGPAGTPDFLFSAPKGSFTVRTGVQQFRAEGQFYDFVIREFSAERDDFRGAGLGVEVALHLAERVEVLLSVDGGGVQVKSESRDWEEVDGSPIRQATRVRMGPTAQGGLRFLLRPRGEAITSLAWVPNRVVPHVSVGGGYSGYELRQWGDFVDAGAAEIFNADFISTGGAGSAFVGMGVDLQLTRSMYAVVEGRLTRSSATLGGDFSRFEPLDLSGARLTAGLSVRF
jgi:hypothetical protein